MRQPFAAGLLACLLAVLIWGLQFPIAKDAFFAVDPFHVTLVRYLVASAVLLPFFIWREGASSLRHEGKAWLVCSMGAMGMSVSPLMVFYGVSIAGAEHGAVVVALQPSVMALVQWVVFRKRPAGFTLVCIGIAFLGVVLVVTRGGTALQDSTDAIVGTMLILAGGLCWVYYTLGTERLAGWSVWRITVLTMLPGGATTLLFVLAVTQAGWLVTPSLAQFRSVAGELAFLALFGVLFGMLAWNFGTRRIGPLNSMLLTNLMPIATFAYRALHGHRFLPSELLGAAVVLAALIANNLYLRSQWLRARPDS